MDNPIKSQVEIDYKYLSLSLNKKLLYNPFSFPVYICSQILKCLFWLEKMQVFKTRFLKSLQVYRRHCDIMNYYNISYKKISDTDARGV